MHPLCYCMVFWLLISDLSYAGSCFSSEVSPQLQIVMGYYSEIEPYQLHGITGFVLQRTLYNDILMDLNLFYGCINAGGEVSWSDMVLLEWKIAVLKKVYTEAIEDDRVSADYIRSIISGVQEEIPLQGLPL